MKAAPRNSPRKKAVVSPNRLRPLVTLGTKPPMAMRMVAGTRLLRRPAKRSTTALGIEANRFTVIADRREGEVRCVAHRAVAPVEPIADHPLLGHEDVRGVEGTQGQRKAARDVEERGQEPDVAREQLAGGDPGRRVHGVARCRQGRHQDERDRHDGSAHDQDAGDVRPAVTATIRLDGDGDRRDDRDRPSTGTGVIPLSG